MPGSCLESRLREPQAPVQGPMDERLETRIHGILDFLDSTRDAARTLRVRLGEVRQMVRQNEQRLDE